MAQKQVTVAFLARRETEFEIETNGIGFCIHNKKLPCDGYLKRTVHGVQKHEFSQPPSSAGQIHSQPAQPYRGQRTVTGHGFLRTLVQAHVGDTGGRQGVITAYARFIVPHGDEYGGDITARVLPGSLPQVAIQRLAPAGENGFVVVLLQRFNYEQKVRLLRSLFYSPPPPFSSSRSVRAPAFSKLPAGPSDLSPSDE